MSKKIDPKAINKLFRDYDEARGDAKDATTKADELNKEIKARLVDADADEVDTTEYVCTYKCDKDKTVTSFDEEGFAAKNPAQYAKYQEMQADLVKIAKKYTKTTTVPGARKLIVTRKEE